MSLLTNRDFCTALVLSLGHFLWQGTVVAAIAWLVVRQCRTVHARYRVFVGGLLVMASCVPITLLVSEASRSTTPRGESVPLTQAPALPPAGDPVAVRANEPPIALHLISPAPPPMMSGESQAVAPVAEPAAPRVALKPVPAEPESLQTRLVPFLTQAYFLGVLLMLLRLMIGLWGGWRLRRSAMPIRELELVAALNRQARILKMKVVPLLAYCEQVAVPNNVMRCSATRRTLRWCWMVSGAP